MRHTRRTHREVSARRSRLARQLIELLNKFEDLQKALPGPGPKTTGDKLDKVCRRRAACGVWWPVSNALCQLQCGRAVHLTYRETAAQIWLIYSQRPAPLRILPKELHYHARSDRRWLVVGIQCLVLLVTSLYETTCRTHS